MSALVLRNVSKYLMWALPVAVLIVGGSGSTVAVASSSTVIHATAQSSICGNGIKEGGEQCDGSDLGAGTCTMLGFSGGTLQCASSCEYDSSPCTTDAEQTVTLLFNADLGGSSTMTNTDGSEIMITLPTDFFSDDVTLQEFSSDQTVPDVGVPPSNAEFVGNMYDLIFVNSDGAVVHSISKPMEIVLSYTNAQIAGLDEQSLTPYRREDGEVQWQSIAGAVKDTQANTITFLTNSFSSFILVGSAPQSVTTPPVNFGTLTGGGWGTFVPTPPPLPFVSILPMATPPIASPISIGRPVRTPGAPRRTPVRVVIASATPTPIELPAAALQKSVPPCGLSCRVRRVYAKAVCHLSKFGDLSGQFSLLDARIGIFGRLKYNLSTWIPHIRLPFILPCPAA